MPSILRTKKGDDPVSLAGVGTLPGNGVGGVLLERAATEVRSLQDDDGNPLEGAALKSAAKKFAEEQGWDVAEVSDDKARKLPELAGGFPDRPPAVEIAEDDAKRFAPVDQAPEGQVPVEEPTEAQPA